MSDNLNRFLIQHSSSDLNIASSASSGISRDVDFSEDNLCGLSESDVNALLSILEEINIMNNVNIKTVTVEGQNRTVAKNTCTSNVLQNKPAPWWNKMNVLISRIVLFTSLLEKKYDSDSRVSICNC